MAQKTADGGLNASNTLAAAMLKALPAVSSAFVTHAEDFIELRVKQRGDMDWLAVARRYDGDGRPQVLFGTGYDLVSCLLGLEGAAKANKWREDKPWRGPAGNG